MESTTKRADLKDFVIRRLNLTDKDYEYMTDMGWSRNSEFATRFTFEQASTIRRCSDNIGYQQIL